MHDGCGDRLGGRVDAERRIGLYGDLLGVGRVGRGVAPAVPDRPVQDNLAVVPQAHLDRRMHAGLIPVAGGLPDPLDGRGVDLGVVLVADCGDGVEVGGGPDSALPVLLAGHACPLWLTVETPPRGYVGAAVIELSTVGRLSTGEGLWVCFRRLGWLVFEHA